MAVISARYVDLALSQADISGVRAVAIESVSIDMSPAFIRGVTESLPHAELTYDKFHVIAHASAALDQTRRIEQQRDPDIFLLIGKLDFSRINPYVELPT